MKKHIIVSIGLSIIMLLTACTDNGKPADDQPARSEVPTAAPTETEPQQSTTEELLAKIDKKDFGDCSEKLISLEPNGPGPLYDMEGDQPVYGPVRFSVDGNMIYVSDGLALVDGKVEMSMFAYDLKDGSVSRIPYEGDPAGYMQMIAVDGRIYTSHSILDVSSGERIPIERCISDDQELSGCCSMTAFDGRIHLFSGAYEGEAEYMMTLDENSGNWERSDIELTFKYPFDGRSVKGMFPDGGFCFQIIEIKSATIYIIRTDADLDPVVCTVVPLAWKELEPLDYSFETVVGRDGYVYFMACLENEFVVYRIAL